VKVLDDASIADHVKEDGDLGVQVHVKHKIVSDGISGEGEALAIFDAGLVM